MKSLEMCAYENVLQPYNSSSCNMQYNGCAIYFGLYAHELSDSSELFTSMINVHQGTIVELLYASMYFVVIVLYDFTK